MAPGAARIRGRLLLTAAGPAGGAAPRLPRCRPGAAPVSRPARGCDRVKGRPDLRGCLPGRFGTRGFCGVARCGVAAVLCLGWGDLFMASSMMDCETPRSLETSSACVPGAGPALPSAVCSVSGAVAAELKLPWQPGRGILHPGWAGACGSRLCLPAENEQGIEKSCVMTAGKMRLVPFEKEQPR